MGMPNPIPKNGHLRYIKGLRKNLRKQEANIKALLAENDRLRIELERKPDREGE